MGTDAHLRFADRNWGLLSRLMGGHAWLYRATGGKLGHRLPGVPPVCVLEHVGARSGRLRSTPLLYLEDGEDVVVIASKGGFPKSPAWYHNLIANPDTFVQVGSEVRPVHARVATPEERERLWPLAVEMYPPYRQYQERTDRRIPVVVLEPRRP